MKGRSISILYLHLVIIIVNLLITAYADKQRIKIGLRETDMPYHMPLKELENYKKKLNEYYIEKTKDNEKLNKYELDIYYYRYPAANQNGRNLILTFMTDLCSALPKREYDMVVIDDRVLFNDIALMESENVYKKNKLEHPSLELFHDLSKYVNKKDLEEIHDPKIVSGGLYKNKKVYGIPFEFDFDVMYYHKGEVYSKEYNDTQYLLDNMENLTWKEFIEQMNLNSQPYIHSFADDDNMLNFVIEYTSSLYNFSSEYDPNYMKLFYNESSIDYYTEFSDLIMPSIKNNKYEEIYTKRIIALITLDNAFSDFINNTNTFFKGKASHSILFRSNYTSDELPLTLPPKYLSSTIHKYLVANKYSKIKAEILAEVALILTDKDAQLFRAEIFNTIPTFDFSKKDSDKEIQTYCNNNPVICNAIDKMKKLYIRDIFKSDYLTTFYDVICYIPIKFKNFLISSDIEYIRSAFENANEFITDRLGSYKALSILVTSFMIIFCFLIIYMTYRLREHSYIKVISPLFCNLIIIGCVLNMLKLFKYIPPYSSTKIKIFFLLGTIGTNLIYIPMFAVAYRIFRIYKTKTFMSNKLNNKRLLIGIFAAIGIVVIYDIVIIFTNRFYYTTIGSVTIARFPIGNYSNYHTLNKIYQTYLTVVVSIKY